MTIFQVQRVRFVGQFSGILKAGQFCQILLCLICLVSQMWRSSLGNAAAAAASHTKAKANAKATI